jgi:hypothetical protein
MFKLMFRRCPGRLAAALCAAAVGVACSAAPAANATLPADVRAFKLNRDACDHFRGEEPTDEARAKFLTDAMRKNCTGTDNALKALRRRYAGNAAVSAALRDYEGQVE